LLGRSAAEGERAMKLPRRFLGWVSASLIVGLCLGAWPAAGRAAVIGYVNNLKITVNVESASIIRGRVVPDNGLLINPGKTDSHMNVPPGPRIVYVYDAAAPGRLLFKRAFTINNPGQRILFSIQLIKSPQGGPPRPGLVVK
jgi:hypothetical protein